MARFKFPPRAYGPFTESNTLPSGIAGVKRFEIWEDGTHHHYVDTPSWRQHQVAVNRSGVRRVKPPDLSPSAFSYDRISHHAEGMIRTRWKQWPYVNPNFGPQKTELTGSLCQTVGIVAESYTDAALKSAAEVAALLKLKSQSVNLGVAFAERSRTAMLVGDSISTILSSVFDFRKGDFKRAFKRLKATPLRKSGAKLTQQWLALQYGWTPLLMDVHGSCEALAKRELLAFNVRVASRKVRNMDSARVHTPAWPHTLSETTKGEVSYHVALNYMPQESLIRSFTSLGLTNPAEIIWELVPFSFVADWFVPVGSWLSALDASNGWTFSSGTVTRRSTCKVRATYVPTWSWIDQYRDGPDFSVQAERFVVERQLYASSPIPGRPGMKDPRSLKHMANAMALLVGLFSGGKLANLSRL